MTPPQLGSTFIVLLGLLYSVAGTSHSPDALYWKKIHAGLPSDTEALQTMRLLLGGETDEAEDGLTIFLQHHFQNKPMHVDDSSRKDRRKWMQIYRRFVRNEDVDGLILANASAFRVGAPLELGRDLELFRIAQDRSGVWGREKIISFYAEQRSNVSSKLGIGARKAKSGTSRGKAVGQRFQSIPSYRSGDLATTSSTAVDHVKIHETFSDGFEIVMHRMQYRSLNIYKLTSALSRFWMSPVTASLHFSPPNTLKIGKATPVFEADEIFVLALDGHLSVRLYPNAVESPTKADASDKFTQERVRIKLEEEDPEVIGLDEGDVLYVPHGCGFDTRTTSKISLHLVLRISTHQATLRDSMLSVIEAVKLVDASGAQNPLQARLSLGAQNGTYADLLRAGVVITAALNPGLGAHMPVSNILIEERENAELHDFEDTIRTHVRQFCKASLEALFDPLIETLATEDPTSLRENGITNELSLWAKSLIGGNNAPKRAQARNLFQKCVIFMRQNSNGVLKDAVFTFARRNAATLARDRIESEVLLNACLQRHGHTDNEVRNKAGSTVSQVRERESTSEDLNTCPPSFRDQVFDLSVPHRIQQSGSVASVF